MNRPPVAHPLHTQVFESATVAIIAADTVQVCVYAQSCGLVTGTFGARGLTLAVNLIPHTDPLITAVILGTHVLVVADQKVLDRGYAPTLGARVNGAGIAVIAGQPLPDAVPILTEVTGGAQATIVTRSLTGKELARPVVVATGISGAGITIVAYQAGAGADAICALVVSCARVAIIAWQTIGGNFNTLPIITPARVARIRDDTVLVVEASRTRLRLQVGLVGRAAAVCASRQGLAAGRQCQRNGGHNAECSGLLHG